MNWFFFASSSWSSGYIYLWVVWRLLKVHSHSGWRLFFLRAADWKRDDFCIFCMPWAVLICAWRVELIRQPPPRTWTLSLSWSLLRRLLSNLGVSWSLEGALVCSLLKICEATLSKTATWFGETSFHYVLCLAWFRSSIMYWKHDINLLLLNELSKMRHINCQLTPGNDSLLTFPCDVESSCNLPKVILSTLPLPYYIPKISENPNIWSSLAVLHFHVLRQAFLQKKQSIQLVPDNADLFSFLRFLFLSFLRAR